MSHRICIPCIVMWGPGLDLGSDDTQVERGGRVDQASLLVSDGIQRKQRLQVVLRSFKLGFEQNLDIA